MLSIMLVPLVFTAALSAGAPVETSARPAEPPVRITLDHRTYERGDRARLTVRVSDDGYLVVFHLDPDGVLRVVFPLDPGDDNFLRGGQSYELRGRGDREAFTVQASSGTGTVYAAWSRSPFRFDDFVRGDHWDYRAIGDSALPRDPEAGLTAIVERMSTGHFDYDVVRYEVESHVAYTAPATYAVTAVYPPPPPPPWCWWGDPWCGGYAYARPFYRSGFSLSISIGWPAYYDPIVYYPVVYRPFFYAPVFIRPCCFFHRPVVIVNRPLVVYPPFGGYRWKAGNPGGGGVIGVQYRPRAVFASSEPRFVGPFVGRPGPDRAAPLGVAWRHIESRPYAAPRSAVSRSGARPASMESYPYAAPRGAESRTYTAPSRESRTYSAPPRAESRAYAAPGSATPRREPSPVQPRSAWPAERPPVSERRPDAFERGSSTPERRAGPPAWRSYAPVPRSSTPAPRSYVPAPRPSTAVPRSYAPAPRSYAPAPVPRSYTPAPRAYAPPHVPPTYESPRALPRAEVRAMMAPARPMRVEAPRAWSGPRSAPAPRLERSIGRGWGDGGGRGWGGAAPKAGSGHGGGGEARRRP